MSEPDANVIVGPSPTTTGGGCSPPSSSAQRRCPTSPRRAGFPISGPPRRSPGSLASRLVVGDADGGLRVDDDAFRRAARAARARPPSDEHAGEPEERRKVLEAFVRNGRITSMPTAPREARVVLDWLAQRFDLGRRYSEAEVNAALEGHADDHVVAASLPRRRGLLDRAERRVLAVGRNRRAERRTA